MTSIYDVFTRVADILESLGVRYHVGGSFASSTYGRFRSSDHVDVVVDLAPEQADELIQALGPDFYLSRSAVDEAMQRGGTFNAIHEESSFKVDFFVKGSKPFDEEELKRSMRRRVGPPGHRELTMKSPEDTVLRKLEWFHRGGRTSERQWQDVVSILVAARGDLDESHLTRWATDLGVRDLLDRARHEAASRGDRP